MLEGITINNNNIIIDNYSNSSINSLNNKSLKNKKRNKSTNIAIITQKPDFDNLCNPCIGIKHIEIINHKPLTLTIQKLKAIYRDLWKLYDPSFFTRSQHTVLFLNKFMQKSWVLFIYSKNIFFNTFKSWLEKVEIET